MKNVFLVASLFFTVSVFADYGKRPFWYHDWNPSPHLKNEAQKQAMARQKRGNKWCLPWAVTSGSVEYPETISEMPSDGMLKWIYLNQITCRFVSVKIDDKLMIVPLLTAEDEAERRERDGFWSTMNPMTHIDGKGWWLLDDSTMMALERKKIDVSLLSREKAEAIIASIHVPTYEEFVGQVKSGKSFLVAVPDTQKKCLECGGTGISEYKVNNEIERELEECEERGERRPSLTVLRQMIVRRKNVRCGSCANGNKRFVKYVKIQVTE